MNKKIKHAEAPINTIRVSKNVNVERLTDMDELIDERNFFKLQLAFANKKIADKKAFYLSETKKG